MEIWQVFILFTIKIEKSIIEIEVEKIKSAIRNVTEKSEKVDEKDLPKSVLNHL